MGMTIDQELAEISDLALKIKANYLARLKTEKIAMLTELQLEIDEMATKLCDDGWWLTYNNLIQQKINFLKGDIDG